MKNTKSNFKSLQGRKNEENKNTNESTWSIFVRRFSFGVPSSHRFVIHFVISLFTSTNNSLKHSGVILNFIIFLLLEKAFRKENIHLISNLIQKQLFSNRCFSKHRKIYLKNYLLKSFFNKASGLKAWNFIKKRPWYRYFHVGFLKVFEKTIFTEHLRATAPDNSSIPTKVLSTDHWSFLPSFFFFFYYW